MCLQNVSKIPFSLHCIANLIVIWRGKKAQSGRSSQAEDTIYFLTLLVKLYTYINTLLRKCCQGRFRLPLPQLGGSTRMDCEPPGVVSNWWCFSSSCPAATETEPLCCRGFHQGLFVFVQLRECSCVTMKDSTPLRVSEKAWGNSVVEQYSVEEVWDQCYQWSPIQLNFSEYFYKLKSWCYLFIHYTTPTPNHGFDSSLQ